MSTVRNLVIIGTGGLAKELAQLARQIDPRRLRWDEITYCADGAEKKLTELPYGKVGLTDKELVALDEKTDVAIGVGYPWVREKISTELQKNGNLEFPNMIHPSVMLDPDMVTLGVGNVITVGCVFTCNIVIGDFNLFNWNSTVGHDVEMGSCNVVNPASSISGHVKIGNSCLIGTGARLLEKIQVTDGVIIGAGAVVVRSIQIPGVYVGIPAKFKKARR